MTKRITRVFTVITLTVAMLISSQIGVLAAAPKVSKIRYEGSGRVEVDFSSKVEYRDRSIRVRDSSGRIYIVKNVDADDDDIEFTIKDYKKGKKYTVTVGGVRKVGTSDYGKVSAKVTIPSDKKNIGRKKAISIAEKHAKKKWNAKNFKDVDAEKDTYKGKAVWEVDFEAKSGGKLYEYEYKIRRSNGKILYFHRERD